MGHTVEVPSEILRKFARASQAFDDLQDALEDYLITHNRRLLRVLRQARREHLAGKTRPFAEFVAELNHSRRRKQ